VQYSPLHVIVALYSRTNYEASFVAGVSVNHFVIEHC
jgi:hypothetical protein